MQFIAQIPYIGGGTNTGYAIRSVTDYGFSAQNGCRSNDANVLKVLIVVTDGQSNEKPFEVTHAANFAQQKGIVSLAVGVGQGINDQELFQIANEDNECWFHIDQFDELNVKLMQLLTRIVNGGNLAVL